MDFLPLVSINIPVYKCEQYIYRCLESVKNQTYKNLEIILVNDSTPDNSVEIIEEYIKEHVQLNIKLIHHKENSGLSLVRNTGINHSTGEFIFFLDSDDDIESNCIELLVNNQKQTNSKMVIAQNRWINTFDQTTKDFGFPTRSKLKIYNSNSGIFKAYCEGMFPITSWNKLINREFIVKNKIFFVQGLYAQDELWMFHCMEKIDTLSIIDDITYNYYLHANSVIFNRTKKNSENHQTILEWVTKSYQQTKDNHRKKLIRGWIINFKKTILQMQWKVLKDGEYFKENYNRMKKAPSLTFSDYCSTDFTTQQKKENLLLNLPTHLGYKIFKKRYEG